MARLLLIKSDVYELGEIIGQGAYGYEFIKYEIKLDFSMVYFLCRCVFKSRNVTTNEIVAIKKMSMLRTRDGLPSSVIREAALLKRMGKTDSDNLIKYVYLDILFHFRIHSLAFID
jgi:hypothetical protein